MGEYICLFVVEISLSSTLVTLANKQSVVSIVCNNVQRGPNIAVPSYTC